MTPWEVIDEALARRRPRRNMTWLAEQLGEKLQTVSNWKARGVPARRLREIGKVLDLTVDQIEGHAPPPWDARPEGGLLPEVAELAQTVNSLPKDQRDLVFDTVRVILLHQPAVSRDTTAAPAPAAPKQTPSPERGRKLKQSGGN